MNIILFSLAVLTNGWVTYRFISKIFIPVIFDKDKEGKMVYLISGLGIIYLLGCFWVTIYDCYTQSITQ